MSNTTKNTRVAVKIKHDAHVDEAYLPHGYVSKTQSLDVAKKQVREILAAYPYLIMED